MNKRKKIPLPEEVKSSFPEEARTDIEFIWDAAGDADRAASTQASEQEIEQQYNNIRQQIGAGSGLNQVDTDDEEIPDSPKVNTLHQYRVWISAAAIVLISVFAGIWYYLQQPIEITAPRGEFVETTLPDGTRMELNSGSTVIHDRSFGNEHRNLELYGEAYFDVASGDQNFRVETQNAYVRATGTRFNVRAWGLDNYIETSVALEEGSVEFASRANPNAIVSLQEGYFSRIQFDDASPSDPEVRPVEEVTAWRNNGFYFSGQPLSAIFDEVERRFDIHITVDAEDLLQRTHSLYLSQPEDAERILETLSHNLGFEYEVADNQFHISK